MKPLEGIRIIDLGRFVSAPFCGMLLADLGAEVIKVEKPVSGEDSRGVGPFLNGESLYVPTFNRNKKGVTIQTRKEEGIQLLKELIQSADVLLENYRPGTLEKMGLGYETIKELNPRIIVASISGFGQTGPDAMRPAFDPIAQAVGGLYAITGTEESGPLGAGTVIVDLTTGLYTAYAILAAVIQREQTGKGQYIDIAMVDCMVSMLHIYVPDFAANGTVPRRHGNRDPLSAPADCYQTVDGYIVMHAGEDKAYEKLQRLIDDARLADPKFNSHQGRVENQEELEEYIRDWFKVRTTDEAERALLESGIMAARVYDIPHIFASEQIKQREMLVEMDVPNAGTCIFQGNPIHMSDLRISYQRAPMVGEHNQEVFGTLLKKEAATLQILKEEGII
mgnify:CR=1 FL=1